ncbi:MAG: hypothetical protein WCT52_01100 [Candidatus Micrarchaeia archaeon]
MRLTLLALLVALSLQLACSNTPPPVVVLSAQLNNGTQHAPVPFQHDNSTAYAAVSGAKVQGFIVFGDSGSYRIATGTDEIGRILRSYYVSQGYSPEVLSQFSAVHDAILGIKDTHHGGESKCRVLTGVDRSPCYDFLSCQKACYTVTSFCLPMALGAGRPFVDAIWGFENNSAALSRAYENEGTTYSLVLQEGSQYNALAYLASLVEINRVATRASQSALYGGYSYCFTPDYSLPALTSIQQAAQKAYKNASKFYAIPDDAEEVSARTTALMAAYALQQVLPGFSNNSSLANATAGLNLSAGGQETGGNNSSQNGAAQVLPALPESAYAIAMVSIGIVLGVAAWLAITMKKKGI